MKFNQNVSLACYNLVCKSKFSLKMISSIMLIIIIMNCSILITKGIEKYYEKLVLDNSRENNIYFELNISNEGKILDDDLETLKKVQEISNVGQPIIYSDVDLLKMTGETSEFYISTERVHIVQENTKQTYEIQEYVEDNIFDMLFLSGNCSYFTDSDKNSFNYYYPEDELFLAGREVQEYGEFVATDTFLQQFGIKDYNDLIGEPFSFFIDSKKYIENVRLAGVYNQKVSEIDLSKNYPALIYCGNQNEMNHFEIEKMSVCVPVNDFESATELGETLEKKNLSKKVFFDGDNAKVLVYVNSIRQLVYYIIFLIMMVGVIAMFLSLCSVLYNRIRENISYYAMMRAVGMKRLDLLFLLSSEQFLLLIVSSFFSFPFVSIGLYLVNYMLQNVLQTEIIVTFGEFIKICAGCTLVVYIGLLIVSAIFLILNQKEQISILLKS